MIYPITSASALQYWRNCPNTGKGFIYANNSMLINKNDEIDKEFYLNQIKAFALENEIEIPIHIMTGFKEKRHKGKEFTGHFISNNLPKRSIIELPGPVYIASPELCFLLAARDLSFPELVKVGYDLCAIYVPDPKEDFLQRPRVPVTDISKITDYLNSVHNISNISLAKKAIQYVLNNSNSPRETQLAFIAILPFSMGGYNLPHPLMNPELHLLSEGARTFGRSTCKGDIVWAKSMVDLEYDSNLSHLSPDQHATDKKRTTALALSGYTVISATSDQFHHFRDIDALFASVRKALGLKPRNELLEKYRDKRWDMLRQVFHSDFKPIQPH